MIGLEHVMRDENIQTKSKDDTSEIKVVILFGLFLLLSFASQILTRVTFDKMGVTDPLNRAVPIIFAFALLVLFIVVVPTAAIATNMNQGGCVACAVLYAAGVMIGFLVTTIVDTVALAVAASSMTDSTKALYISAFAINLLTDIVYLVSMMVSAYRRSKPGSSLDYNGSAMKFEIQRIWRSMRRYDDMSSPPRCQTPSTTTANCTIHVDTS
jgi:hypothetical protein